MKYYTNCELQKANAVSAGVFCQAGLMIILIMDEQQSECRTLEITGY